MTAPIPLVVLATCLRELVRASAVPLRLILYLPVRRKWRERAREALAPGGQWLQTDSLDAFLQQHRPVDKSSPHILVSAGEASGEIHAAGLMAAVEKGGRGERAGTGWEDLDRRRHRGRDKDGPYRREWGEGGEAEPAQDGDGHIAGGGESNALGSGPPDQAGESLGRSDRDHRGDQQQSRARLPQAICPAHFLLQVQHPPTRNQYSKAN